MDKKPNHYGNESIGLWNFFNFHNEKFIQFHFQADVRFPDVMDPAIQLANFCHIEGLFVKFLLIKISICLLLFSGGTRDPI